MVLGTMATRALGATPETVEEISGELRRRDNERLELETSGGPFAGTDLIFGNLNPRPAEQAGGGH